MEQCSCIQKLGGGKLQFFSSDRSCTVIGTNPYNINSIYVNHMDTHKLVDDKTTVADISWDQLSQSRIAVS